MPASKHIWGYTVNFKVFEPSLLVLLLTCLNHDDDVQSLYNTQATVCVSVLDNSGAAAIMVYVCVLHEYAKMSAVQNKQQYTTTT